MKPSALSGVLPRWKLGQSALALCLAGCLSHAAAAPPQQAEPRLVLLLVVDQGRADYFERFRPALRGGLSTLLERGVSFRDAHHDHADTSTAPGHGSLATGLYPGHSGIVGNDWYERQERRAVYCVEDADAALLEPSGDRISSRRARLSGRSPKNLLGTALGDWIREAHPGAKVYAVASKDRAAVLMAGKNADGAFWYDAETGQLVTSRYYMTDYPSWVRDFQSRRVMDGHFGALWTPLPVSDAELESMDIVNVGGTGDDAGFPHAIGPPRYMPDRRFYDALNESPFMMSFVLDFARALVREEELGRDGSVDLLAIGFSTVDYVGHAYGPNSREVLDVVLRLDGELGRFFEFLDRTVGMEHVAVALSADHGAAPLPEYQRSKGLFGQRLTAEAVACFQRLGPAFEERYGGGDWFADPQNFDEDVLREHGVPRAEAELLAKRHLEGCPGVARVWTRTEIEAAAAATSWDDALMPLFVNGYFAGRSPDLVVQLEEYVVARGRGTTHGAPYDYDTHVPMIVLWPGAEPKAVAERVHTVDLAVTLASLLGVPVPEDVDGVDRSGYLRVDLAGPGL